MKLYQLLVLIVVFSSAANADRFCFSYAESYYEQIYCEVQASGKGAGLPSMYDFRRNDERVQALLLKRFARRIGIELKMPASSSRNTVIEVGANPVLIDDNSFSGCELKINSIHCGTSRYKMVTNRTNKQLGNNALATSNRMNLAIFKGSLSDSIAVEMYLSESYQHYLSKMMEIGLGAATLSYAKFAFLFSDLNRKGIDFQKRFETMYRYLKQDKKNIAVTVKSKPPPGLTLEYCYRLERLILCSIGMTNIIFVE